MDNIQNVLDRLEASNPQLAREVRKAMDDMATVRDMAIAKARNAEAKAHDLALERAQAKLEANGQKFEPYKQEPQKFMLRSDFDKLTPHQQHDAIINQHIRIVQ